MNADIAELEHAAADLDRLNLEIIGLQRLEHPKLRAELAARGFNVDGFNAAPPLHRLEHRSGRTPFVEPHLARAQLEAAKRGRLFRPALGVITRIY